LIQDLIEQKSTIDKRIAEEQRFLAINQWNKAREEAREARVEVRRLKQEYLSITAEWEAYQRQCLGVLNAIEAHYGTKPQYDDLPTEDEVKEWEDDHAELVSKLEGMRAQRDLLATNQAHAQMEMIKADRVYIQLGYAERNARAKAVNETGVNRVAI
jgi:hypothetical protein